jgi:hypothetical protein
MSPADFDKRLVFYGGLTFRIESVTETFVGFAMYDDVKSGWPGSRTGTFTLSAARYSTCRRGGRAQLVGVPAVLLVQTLSDLRLMPHRALEIVCERRVWALVADLFNNFWAMKPPEVQHDHATANRHHVQLLRLVARR